MRASPARRAPRSAFSLIELLAAVAVIAVLVSMLLPALGAARESAHGAGCAANQRSLVTAWQMYARDFDDRAMPLAEFSGAEQVFWWGTHGTASLPPDHSRGLIAPYLDAGLHARSAFECPRQPWGTYRPQGPSRSITSTYGYNGYYLTPERTPGWSMTIGFRPWRRLFEVERPTELFVFADAMLGPSSATGTPMNCALLDPPRLFDGASWTLNEFPTTSFRHERRGGAFGRTIAARADGSVRGEAALPEHLTDPRHGIGSVGGENDPAYVPDWRRWAEERR